MHDYINTQDFELWDIILDGPYVSTKEVNDREPPTTFFKTRKDYNEADRKKIEKNYKEKIFGYVELEQMNTTKSLCVRFPKRFGTIFNQSMK